MVLTTGVSRVLEEVEEVQRFKTSPGSMGKLTQNINTFLTYQVSLRTTGTNSTASPGLAWAPGKLLVCCLTAYLEEYSIAALFNQCPVKVSPP